MYLSGKTKVQQSIIHKVIIHLKNEKKDTYKLLVSVLQVAAARLPALPGQKGGFTDGVVRPCKIENEFHLSSNTILANLEFWHC